MRRQKVVFPVCQEILKSNKFVLLLVLALTQNSFQHVRANIDESRPGGLSIGEKISEIGFYQSIDIQSADPIYKSRSDYQDITVFESKHYGKILVLDGVLQLTEVDAASYNEMMVHIPMMDHISGAKNVLVIGGGDGYVLSEVLKYDSVERVDHVDLDSEVIEVCKKFFSWGRAWDDKRVSLHVSDGAAFVKDSPDGFYDVVIQDSSDPFTWNDVGEIVPLPSGSLYTKEHITHIKRILSVNGVFNFQAETFQIPSDINGIVEWRRNALDIGFETVKYGTLYISSYPTGQIGFLLCRKNENESSNADVIRERFNQMISNGHVTKYYHPDLHKASFVLPLWVTETIYGDSCSK